MKIEDLLRAAAVLSFLVAGSCAPINNETSIGEDGAVNHPISVEPSYRDLKVSFAGPVAGMSPDDAMKFDTFLYDYRVHGNGAIGISVPAGPPSRDAITYFAERAAQSGVPRDKILVSVHDVKDRDFRVDVSYVAYVAHADDCGDWSENLSFSGDNLTPKNFGCSVQHNIAAQVADPRDLLGPQVAGPVDGNRRATVMGNYEQGKPTAADKHTVDGGSEQSAPGSGIGN